MCHGHACSVFPDPGEFVTPTGPIVASIFGAANSLAKIAILPDIFGVNPFYQGLATRWADKGAEVHLIDVFAGLGDLPKATREAAFGRRHKLKDKQFVDRFEAYAKEQQFTGVVGFCLGGLYIFELARRQTPGALIAFYPFPQGLPNQDAVDVPFDYLSDVDKTHTVLVGSNDASLGDGVLERLQETASNNHHIDLHVFAGSEHGFLADLDNSESPEKQDNAATSLSICEAKLGL